MKLKIETAKVYPYLKRMMNFIPKKPIVPIYDCFRITAENNSMEIFAFDGARSVSTILKCESIDSGSWAVPASLLTNTLRLINDQEVVWEFSKTHLIMKSGRKNLCKISVHDGKNYPSLRICEKNNEVSFTCSDFRRDVLCMIDFCDKESQKEFQRGVHFKLKGSDIYMEAANDFMCGQIKAEPRSIVKWDSIVIPAEVCKVVAETIDERDIVKVFHDGKQVLFSTPNYEISSTLIDKKYPDTEVIFNKFEKAGYVKTDSFVTEVGFKKIKLYANGNVPFEAIMSFSGNEMKIDASDVFFGNQAEEYIEINENNLPEDMSLKVRADQLLGIVKAIGEGELLIFINSPDKPLYIRKTTDDTRRFLVTTLI